jgi:hypothetical protein
MLYLVAAASASQPLQLHRAPRHPGLETCSAYATQRKFNINILHAVSVSGLQLLDTAYYSLRSMPIYPNVVSTNSSPLLTQSQPSQIDFNFN